MRPPNPFAPLTKPCHDCGKPAARYRCVGCQRRREAARTAAWRQKNGNRRPDRREAPKPPPKPMDPRDPFQCYLRAGWADVDGTEIPPDVRRDAEAGRTPRLHPKLAERRSA